MIGKLLSTIKAPSDICRLSISQLNNLAEELRQHIKDSVSIHGGHLASNLGIVELTIAMHYVFDFARDRLVWDVGHQCYVHKMLTGRASQFDKLRQKDGISGFPNPKESDYDQFAVGHAGTAVATAVGLALGAQLQNSTEKVVSVIGDASIVNGLSFEGLNNTNLVKRQLLFILNDNEMAIDKTQGAFANYLTKMRVSRPNDFLNRSTHMFMRRLPLLKKQLDKFKEGVKTAFLGNHWFDQLNVPVYGPIDGHNISNLIEIFSAIKDFEHPIILHVHTDKGRGFTPATDDPTTFHSPRPFKIDGESASFDKSKGKSFTASFADSLAAIMSKDEKVYAITAAMPDGTGLSSVREQFPDRVIDVGIAESAAVDIAAGMAKTGLKPVVAIYSTFLQRGFDQVFQEVSLQGLPVVFCLDRAGMVGGDGAVHHGFTDIAIFRTLPNLELISPSDNSEMLGALEYAVDSGKACLIRYPRASVAKHEYAEIGGPSGFSDKRARQLKEGDKAVILAYGSMAYDSMTAANILQDEGIEVAVYDCRFAKPLDMDTIVEIYRTLNGVPIITVEDHALIGGFGSAVLEFVQESGLDTSRLFRMGFPDKYIGPDTREGQLEEAGINSKAIADNIKSRICQLKEANISHF